MSDSMFMAIVIAMASINLASLGIIAFMVKTLMSTEKKGTR